jgi:3-phenylpropionate/trans-cinnamate dioxygenase ferredoxin subunit
MAEWTKVATLEDCPPGSLHKVMVGANPVVLTNIDGSVHAIMDRCTHEELPLSDGEMEGNVIVCPYHGARYDVTSGAARGLPAIKPVKSFPVEIREDGIYIESL